MSKKALNSLHDALTTVLLDAVQNGVTLQDNKGELVKTAAPAAILNVARQFLKDNNIDAIPAEGSKIASLAISLPFANKDDHDDFTRQH